MTSANADFDKGIKMTQGLVRSIIAAVVGMIMAFGLIWLFQYSGSMLPSSGSSDSDYVVATEIAVVPIAPTIALILQWFLGTFSGGWLAMRDRTLVVAGQS